MNNNTLSLHYIDKNWQKRGYAKHIHLIIDYDKKVYRKVENYMLPDFTAYNHIEVKRKSDIEEYIQYLDFMGFKETDEEIVR